jgi:Na+-transporting NADH:ubiquinone oxidoreductase subunit NqrC
MVEVKMSSGPFRAQMTNCQIMQKETDQRKFVIPVTKVHERVASTPGVSKSAAKSIKKEMLNLQAGAATSYSTPKRNRNFFFICKYRSLFQNNCLKGLDRYRLSENLL